MLTSCAASIMSSLLTLSLPAEYRRTEFETSMSILLMRAALASDPLLMS